MNSNQHRVEKLLDQALARPEAERAAFLAGACGEDHVLRKEVESFLISADDAEGFMETVSNEDIGSLAEKPGVVIGNYKLLQKIGEGGFGTVYMAEQEQPIRRRVALKIIKAGMDTKQVVARFEAERQALAMMDHTNIARVFDGGSTESGRSFFAMELVKGVPITQYCDEQKLSTEERLHLFMDVCSAVQHAHQKGVIHRDIKPSNVLVTLYDGRPVPKVIDFGIAKAIDQRLTDKTLFTQFEQMIGTPDFMSPEQAEMSGLDVDTRSDIYSLGVLLYVLLTGQKPFDWGQTGLDEIRRRIKEEDPPKPSTRVNTLAQDQLTTTARHRNSDGGRLQSQLRGDLDWIVMKAIEKDRTRRYETANAFRLDVERYLNHELVSAVAPSVSYRMSKFVRKNRAAVLTGGAIAIVLLVATLISSISAFWAWSESQEKESALDQLQIEQGRTSAALAESRRNEAALEQQSIALESARDEALLNQYAADMKNAQVALDAGNFEAAEKLLERYRDEPLRGWEWDFLRRQLSGDEHEVMGKIDARRAYLGGISDDGQHLLIGTGRGDVMVWDVSMRNSVWKKGGFGNLGPASLALKGDLVAIGNRSGTWKPAQLWNWRQDKLLWEAKNSAAILLDLSARDPWLALNDGMFLTVLDYRTGETVFQSHQGGLDPRIAELETSRSRNNRSPVAFSQDGKLLARAMAGDEFVEVWDMESRERVMPPQPLHDYSFEREENSTWALAFGPSNELIVTFLFGSPMILDTQTRAVRRPISNPHAWSLQSSPNGEFLFGGGADHGVHIWSAETYELIRTLRGHRGELANCAFSPDGASIYSVDFYGNIFRWPWPNRPRSQSQYFSSSEIDVQSQSFFDPADEDVLWIHNSSGNAEKLNLVTGERQKTSYSGLPVGFSADGAEYLSLDAGDEERNWSLLRWHLSEASKTEVRLSLGGELVGGSYCSVTDELLLSVDLRSYQIVSTITGKILGRIRNPDERRMVRPRISRSGRWLGFVSDKHVILYERRSSDYEEIGAIPIGGESRRPRDFTFSPNERYMAVSSLEHFGYLIDLEGSELSPRLIGHSKRGMQRLQFSPDSRSLICPSDDNCIRAWNIESGRELMTISLEKNPSSVHISPSAKWLVAKTGSQSPFNLDGIMWWPIKE